MEDILSLVGRQPKSTVIRDALKFYYEHLQRGKQWTPTILPNPRFFEEKLHQMSAKELEFYICETSRLYNLTKLVQSAKKLVEK